MSRKLKVAIMGCGRVAGHHARSVLKLPQFQLIAVCDINRERADGLAKETGVPAFYDMDALLTQHPEVDVVSVITPSGMHFEHAVEVITRHKKHVVIEKPVVMTLEQGAELEAAAKKAGVQVFPVFQYRFNKSVQRLREAMASGELGDLVLATVRTRWCRPQRYYDRDAWRGTFSLDGGATTNQGIHHLDLLRYLAGEVQSVNSTMATLGAKIEVEDTVVATLKFASGALGVVEVTTAARPDDFESSISIVGSKGLAMVGGWATNELIRFSPDPQQEKLNSETFPDVYGFGHFKIYEGVYRAVVEGGQPAVTFSDAMNSIGLLHSIYRSDEEQGWVNVGERLSSSRLGRPDEKLADLYRTHKKLS